MCGIRHRKGSGGLPTPLPGESQHLQPGVFVSGSPLRHPGRLLGSSGHVADQTQNQELKINVFFVNLSQAVFVFFRISGVGLLRWSRMENEIFIWWTANNT